MTQGTNGAWLALGMAGAVAAAGAILKRKGQGSRYRSQDETLAIQSTGGKTYYVRLVPPGGKYGLNRKLTNEGPAMLEFYWPNPKNPGEMGNFTGERYYLTTLSGGRGLMLQNDREAIFSAETIKQAINWALGESEGSMSRAERLEASVAPESMVNHYLVTALWSSIDNKGNPMDGKYDTADFTVKARSQAVKDCDDFVAACQEAGLEDALFQNGHDTAGHDFWLTRNGHGAGFWDGDYGKEGDALNKIAKRFPEINLYANRGKVGME